eukprot:COSAG06_NODE_3400_length_5395_cov_78.114992_6_plen_178_part_00
MRAREGETSKDDLGEHQPARQPGLVFRAAVATGGASDSLSICRPDGGLAAAEMTGPAALTGSSATGCGASATGGGRAPDGGPGFDAAASFVMQVKRRLANEENYSRFIEILRHYHQAKSQSKRTVLLDAVLVLEVNEKVAVLFAEHPDLLAGFRAFLPDAAMVVQTDEARADESVLC